MLLIGQVFSTRHAYLEIRGSMPRVDNSAQSTILPGSVKWVYRNPGNSWWLLSKIVEHVFVPGMTLSVLHDIKRVMNAMGALHGRWNSVISQTAQQRLYGNDIRIDAIGKCSDVVQHSTSLTITAAGFEKWFCLPRKRGIKYHVALRLYRDHRVYPIAEK